MSVTRNQTATSNTHPHSVHCDRPDCEWRTAHSSYDVAVRTDATHPCPYQLVKRKYMTGITDDKGMEYTKPTHGKSLIEEAWDELDAHLDILMTTTDEAAKYTNTGWCQALAWTIHTWTKHWYPTVEDVTREAVKRREIRLGQRDWEPTAGYKYNPIQPGHARYQEVNSQSSGEQGKGKAAVKKTVAKKAAAFTPSKEDIEAIKAGLEMGVSPEELAKMLKIPEAVVTSYA